MKRSISSKNGKLVENSEAAQIAQLGKPFCLSWQNRRSFLVQFAMVNGSILHHNNLNFCRNISVSSCGFKTRRERLMSALYLRLKKRKRLFSNFLIFFFQKMSHSAEKCKRGDPLGFINIYSVAKYQKTRKGDSFETIKNFRKKSLSAETN